jgi:ABC-type Fe3+ transport system permease subunit
MRRRTSAIAALDLVLLFPAALFMAALVFRNLGRNLGPLPYGPAHTAQQIVLWYAGKVWTLWVLLVALPLVVLASGSATLLRGWDQNGELPHTARPSPHVISAHPATILVALTTLAAAGILAIVVLHMLAN